MFKTFRGNVCGVDSVVLNKDGQDFVFNANYISNAMSKSPEQFAKRLIEMDVESGFLTGFYSVPVSEEDRKNLVEFDFQTV